MFTELLNSFQSMNSTSLTILIAACGVVYFMYIKPALAASTELQRIHAEKILNLPTPDDLTKMMEAMGNIVSISVKESVTVLEVMGKKVDEIHNTVNTLTHDLRVHVEDEGVQNEEQSEMLGDLMSNSESIEAVVEYLLTELAKSGTIPPVDTHQLNELKSRVADTKVNLSHMMSLLNKHMSGSKKQTKLNRVMNQTRS